MSMDSHQSKKNSYTYCKSLLRPRSKVLLRMPQEGQIGRKTRPRLPLIRKTIKRAPHATNLSHNFYHSCMLWDLPTSTKVFLNFIITHQHDPNITTSISQNNYRIKLIIAFNSLPMIVFIIPNLDAHHSRTKFVTIENTMLF